MRYYYYADLINTKLLQTINDVAPQYHINCSLGLDYLHFVNI